MGPVVRIAALFSSGANVIATLAAAATSLLTTWLAFAIFAPEASTVLRLLCTAIVWILSVPQWLKAPTQTPTEWLGLALLGTLLALLFAWIDCRMLAAPWSHSCRGGPAGFSALLTYCAFAAAIVFVGASMRCATLAQISPEKDR